MCRRVPRYHVTLSLCYAENILHIPCQMSGEMKTDSVMHTNCYLCIFLSSLSYLLVFESALWLCYFKENALAANLSSKYNFKDIQICWRCNKNQKAYNFSRVSSRHSNCTSTNQWTTKVHLQTFVIILCTLIRLPTRASLSGASVCLLLQTHNIINTIRRESFPTGIRVCLYIISLFQNIQMLGGSRCE